MAARNALELRYPAAEEFDFLTMSTHTLDRFNEDRRLARQGNPPAPIAESGVNPGPAAPASRIYFFCGGNPSVFFVL
jgi:hypothetical protein